MGALLIPVQPWMEKVQYVHDSMVSVMDVAKHLKFTDPWKKLPGCFMTHKMKRTFINSHYTAINKSLGGTFMSYGEQVLSQGMWHVKTNELMQASSIMMRGRWVAKPMNVYASYERSLPVLLLNSICFQGQRTHVDVINYLVVLMFIWTLRNFPKTNSLTQLSVAVK